MTDLPPFDRIPHSIKTGKCLSAARFCEKADALTSPRDLLTNCLPDLFVPGPRRLDSPLLFQDLLEIDFPPPTRHINLPSPPDLCLIHKLESDVHDDDDRGGQVYFKEAFDELRCRHVGVPHGCKTGPELRHEDQDVHDQAEPGAVDGGLRLEGQFVESVAGESPGSAETDVTQADGGPGEEEKRESAFGIYVAERGF